MERQLANLTGLVQKALTHAPHTSPSPREYLQVPPGRDPYARAAGTCLIKPRFRFLPLVSFRTFDFAFTITSFIAVLGILTYRPKRREARLERSENDLFL